MGADLCGYIMCGPGRLDRKKVASASERLLRLSEAAANPASEAGKKRAKELGVFAAAWWDEDQEGESVATFLAKLDAAKLVDDFVEMWEQAGYRDMMVRDDPNRKGHVIVVAGERTCGDGPEPGSAWFLSDQACKVGLFGMLGIE